MEGTLPLPGHPLGEVGSLRVHFSMNFDALTLMAVTDELRRTIVGGRIQRVLLPTPLSLGLEVYHAGQRYYLVASADPRAARIHLLQDKPTRGVDRETPLVLLLRKYIRNGFITAIEQPPLERVLVLSIIKHPPPRKDADLLDDDDNMTTERRCELVIELMGQRANIILVDDDNLILDAVKRIPSDGTRRSIMPRDAYILPTRATNMRDPRRVTEAGIRALLEGSERNLAKAIIGAYSGVSPQQAREVLVRVLGQPKAELNPQLPFAALAQELRTLWTEPFTSSVAYEDDHPIAFAPYHMQQYKTVLPAASISAALETFYAAVDTVTAHSQRREALKQRLVVVRERLQRQFEALSRELSRAAALDQLRWEGEMIFGYLHAITSGQRELRVEEHVIALDPDKTPVENAQARFREYDKAKGALTGVPERLAATDGQLRYLDETIALLELADSYDAIAAIEREVTEQGLLKASGKSPARGPRAAPLRLRSSEGLPILIGRSAGQNEEVTFRLARPDDLWLHVRDMPGAHVVVLAEGQVGNQTLEEAAGLAVYFSRARTSTTAEVIVTQRRNVRKVAGGPPGLVNFRNEHTVRVAPLAPADLLSAIPPPDQQ